MDKEKAYEELAKQHMKGEEISIPSIVDALPLIKIHKDIDFDQIIATQLEGIRQSIKDHKLKSLAPKRAVTFFIPLTSFLPLPEPYYAAAVDKVNNTKKQVNRFTCVTIKSYYTKIKSGDDDVLLKLSCAIVTIGNSDYGTINTHIERNKNIYTLYQDAIDATNKVIDSYKATPMRHNHLLQPITPLGTAGHVYALVVNTVHGNIISHDSIMLHEHLFGELFASRKMKDDELYIFQQIHIRNALINDLPLRMIKKLNEAIDARCVGRNESAVILADHYAEQAMRYWLYRVLLEKGTDEKLARKGSSGFATVKNLKDKLAQELEFEVGEFDRKIHFSKWYQLCRKKRNDLAHDFIFDGDIEKISFDAVQESASLIKIIAELVVEKHPSLYEDGQIFWASTWMLDTIKHQP